MTMYRRILAVVGVVLVVAGVGGFFMLKESAVGPSPWAGRALVTGYATSNIRGQTTGAVSVELNGESAARIDQIVEGLPPANLEYICAENEQEYRIAFTAAAGTGVKQAFGLTGYWCNNLVVETLSHGTTMDRIDRDCALLAAVRQLLPARATATHLGTCAHANGRLYLAVSRTVGHRTLGHGTSADKTPADKTPAHKTVRHKTPAHKTVGHQTPRREASPRGRVKHGAPVRVTPGRGTLGREMPARGTPGRETPGSGTRDVKKVVTAPTFA